MGVTYGFPVSLGYALCIIYDIQFAKQPRALNPTRNPLRRRKMHQHPPPTRYRFTIFFLIVVIALVNYIDRGAIAYSAGQIIEEYGFDRAGWGAVLGYFGYGYM